MAVDIETIGIGFDTSGLQRGQRELDKTRGAANKTADAADKTGRSFSALSSAVKAAAAAFAVIGGAMIAREFIQAADAVALLNARLKLATGGGLEFAQAQQEVYRISQANNIGLAETATLYTKLAEPIKLLGGGVQETAAIVDAFATSLRISGASTQEASSATLQFAQAMGSGKLSGDEFRSMAEASPRFMKALADGLGVPTGALKDMAANGELTADVVGNALTGALGKLKTEAAGLPDTVGGAFTRIKNDWLLAVDEINKESGLTGGLTEILEVARKLIPTIKDELVGAFQGVGEWINRNREMLGEVWDITKSIIGDAWGLVKGFAAVAGGVYEVGIQTGVVQTALIAVRYLIAGLQDGVKFVGAAFASLGSLVLKVLLHPLQMMLTASAKIAGVFNDELAAKINGINAELSEFAGSGARYGAEVVAAFGNGDMAVARLTASMGAAKTATESAKIEAENTNTTYVKLGGNIKAAGDGKEAKLRAKALKEEANAAKKAFEEYSKLFDRLMEDRDSLRGETTEMREYNERIGLSKEAIAELDAAKLESMAVNKEENAILAETVDLSGEMSRLYREQADELREQAKLKREGSKKEATIEEQKKIAEESKKVWDNFTENVQRNLGDGLYDAMNGNFKNIGDSFKSMILRMSADAMAADLMGALTGKKSSGSAFGSLFSSIGGLFSGASSSGGGYSVGGDAGIGLSFAGGGFTGSGSRSGGVDGLGGFPAILHPNETVIDHTKGQSAGGGKRVQITYSPVFQISGALDESRTRQIAHEAAMAGNADLMDRMERERI